MKRTVLLLISLVLLIPNSWAEEAKPAKDLAATLSELELKLDHAARRANQPSAGGSSVVGLRGAKQEPVSKQLYWKGKTGNTPVTPDQIKAFRTAVEQAKAGKNDEAIAGLKSFIAKYPKSGLRPDAETTLGLLTAPPTPVPPQTASPPKP